MAARISSKPNWFKDNTTYQAVKGIWKPKPYKKGENGQNEPIDPGIAISGGEYLKAFLASLVIINNKVVQKKESDSVYLFGSKSYEHNSDYPLVTYTRSDDKNLTLQFHNIVGQINVPFNDSSFHINISSRFGDKFLKHIISTAEGFMEIDDSGDTDTGVDNYWLLEYIWAMKLARAYRIGLPKEYRRITRMLRSPKGQIDPVGYYLTKRTGKYLCTYSEHSYDTDAARLISTVFRLYKNRTFINNLNEISNAFANATRGIKHNIREVLQTKDFSNPFYHDYNETIQLSKMLLAQKGLNLSGNDKSSAFLFDVSMLFEYHIRNLLKRNGINVLPKDKSDMLIHAGVGKPRKLKPDIIIEKDNKYHIYDVKYKRWDNTFGVKREDLFQLYTYVSAYQSKNPKREIGKCGIIYPGKGPNGREPISQSKGISIGDGIDLEILFYGASEKTEDKENGPKEYKCFDNNIIKLFL